MYTYRNTTCVACSLTPPAAGGGAAVADVTHAATLHGSNKSYVIVAGMFPRHADKVRPRHGTRTCFLSTKEEVPEPGSQAAGSAIPNRKVGGAAISTPELMGPQSRQRTKQTVALMPVKTVWWPMFWFEAPQKSNLRCRPRKHKLEPQLLRRDDGFTQEAVGRSGNRIVGFLQRKSSMFVVFTALNLILFILEFFGKRNLQRISSTQGRI